MSTLETVLNIAGAGRFSDTSRAMARLSLFDWMVCGLAARDEPVARALRQVAEAEGGAAQASVIGGGEVPARMAAMANGTASHALDFDDTHFAHIGHLSVGIYPAALAAGEVEDRAADEVVTAFLAGAEAAIRVGLHLGRAHYDRGFHQTATAGAFGATVAAGRLIGLDRDGMRRALGLCATRASGLKGQFGTMGKPLNAGIAASNGVECAMLARAGLTSADDGLTGPQGFVPTHSDDPRPVDVPGADTPLFDEIKYKLHACCHGTHAMIEALAVAKDGLVAEDVAGIEIRTHPRWLKVCDIKKPRTGLEVKFSYAWIAAMVMDGREAADRHAFDDACAADEGLTTLAARVTVAGDESLTDMQAAGHIATRAGERIDLRHDLAEPVPADALARALRHKAAVNLGEAAAERLWAACETSGEASARGLGALLADGP